MPTPRANLAVVTVGGLIYAIGGYRFQAPTSYYYATVEVYDPGTDMWSTLAPMPEATRSMAVAVVGQRIYLFGGYNASLVPLAKVWVYDVVGNSWSRGPDMPAAVQAACAAALGSSIHLVDGADDVAGSAKVARHYVLDTATGTWASRAPDPLARTNAACAAIGDFLYVFGDVFNDLYRQYSVVAYDTQLNSWSSRSQPWYMIDFWGLRAAVVGVHLFWIGGHEYGSPLSDGVNEEYDPSADVWTDRAWMPTARADHGVAVVNGKIYAIGGANYGLQAWYATNEEYTAIVDFVPPTVDIAWPTPGETVNVAQIDVRGNASDDQGVARVNVRVNGGSWLPANGTSTWDKAVLLVLGMNTIEAQSFDTTGNPSGIASMTVRRDPGFRISFTASDLGWRLVSFPLILSDTSSSAVLSSMAGRYRIVRSYNTASADPWRAYDPSRTGNDLRVIDNTMAFWIEVTAPGTLDLEGTRPTSAQSVPLRAGWNLVGFPSYHANYTVGDFKADTGATRVEGFDASNVEYGLRVMADVEFLATGDGLWVLVPADTVWQVPV